MTNATSETANQILVMDVLFSYQGVLLVTLAILINEPKLFVCPLSSIINEMDLRNFGSWCRVCLQVTHVGQEKNCQEAVVDKEL